MRPAVSLVILVVAMSFPMPVMPQEIGSEERLAEMASAMVFTTPKNGETLGGRGSALLIGLSHDSLFVLTAKHILYPDARIQILLRWAPNDPRAASIRHVSRTLDLAVLSVEVKASDNLPPQAALWDRLGSPEELEEGEAVRVIGNPITGPWRTSPAGGRFLTKDGNEVIYAAESIEPGYSGGPVFGPDWELLGMHLGRLSEAQLKALEIGHALSVLPADIPISLTKRVSVSTVLISGERSVPRDGEVRLSARALGPDGAVLRGRSVTWRSSDETVATVSTTGRVSGLRSGTVSITATAGGVTDRVAVTVLGVPVDFSSVDFGPDSFYVYDGDRRHAIQRYNLWQLDTEVHLDWSEELVSTPDVQRNMRATLDNESFTIKSRSSQDWQSPSVVGSSLITRRGGRFQGQATLPSDPNSTPFANSINLAARDAAVPEEMLPYVIGAIVMPVDGGATVDLLVQRAVTIDYQTVEIVPLGPERLTIGSISCETTKFRITRTAALAEERGVTIWVRARTPRRAVRFEVDGIVVAAITPTGC